MSEHKIEPVIVHITPRMNLLADIATTAVEGGGIFDWCILVHYKWMETSKDAAERVAKETDPLSKPIPRILVFPEIVLTSDGESDDEFKQFGGKVTITPEIIVKGLQLAMTPGVLNERGNTFRSVIGALFEEDAGRIDSDAADNIIQLGLFGKLVFA